MTKFFVFCTKRRPRRFHGRPFIGNCGYVRKILHRVDQVMCQPRKTLRENLRFCLYRGVSAINFTAEPTARDAISSTFVLSVTEHIPLTVIPLTVIFAVQPKNLPMNDRPSLFRPPLPTPVKVSNLKLY